MRRIEKCIQPLLCGRPIHNAMDGRQIRSAGWMQEVFEIDLSQAFLQLTFNEESRKFTTVNTSWALYQFRRIPFGVASASAIFERKIESVVLGVPHIVVPADDILVSGLDDEEYLFNVNEVLSRLDLAGLRAKRQKCGFLLPEVIYMDTP